MSLQALSENRDHACEQIAHRLEPIMPKGFRAKIQIMVEDGKILPHNVTVELRPAQPRRS